MELLKHQMEAENKFLNFGKKMIFAWEMGTGKTVGSLNIALKNAKEKKIIVITPKFLKKQWFNEILKFNFAKEEDIFLSKSKDDLINNNLTKYKIIIIHYEQLRDFCFIDDILKRGFEYKILNKFEKRESLFSKIRTFKDIEMIIDRIIDYEVLNYKQVLFKVKDVEIIKSFMCFKDNVFLILDELYKVKNYKTQLYKSIKNFINILDIKDIIGLDGTPFYNDVFETYNIVNLIKKDSIKYNELQNFYYKGKWGNFIYRNLDKFNLILKNRVMDRVRKKEVEEYLPQLIEKDYYVDNSKELNRLKYLLIEEFQNLFEIYTLLRVSDSYYNFENIKRNAGSKLVDFLEKSGYNKEINNQEKVDVLVDLIENLRGNKIIVFSCFANTVYYLNNILKDKYRCGFVTSRVDEKTKLSIVNNFLNNDLEILITTDVLSRGLNATNIDYLINFDITPSLAIMLQRNNRIHRIDSKNGKVVINLISNVIENDILEILRRKQKNFNLVVDGNNDDDIIVDEKVVLEIANKWGVSFKKNAI